MNDDSADGRGGLVRLLLQDDVLTFTVVAHGGQLQSTSNSILQVRNALGRGILTEQKLEEAIARTEDCVIPMIRSSQGNAELEVLGSELADVFHLLSAEDDAQIPIESVEYLFNQLADHAGGSVKAWRQPIAAARVAPGLVVLREVMHHGGFGVVTLSCHAK